MTNSPALAGDALVRSAALVDLARFADTLGARAGTEVASVRYGDVQAPRDADPGQVSSVLVAPRPRTPSRAENDAGGFTWLPS